MTSKQISRDDVEDVGVLQMIRKTFGNQKSVKDFLELEMEVLTLLLMLSIDVHSDCSSIVREYRRVCQHIHLLDDGYHRWAAESYCRITDQWLDIDRTLHPQLIRELLSRACFEAERPFVKTIQTVMRGIFLQQNIEHQPGECSTFTQGLVYQGAASDAITSRHKDIAVEALEFTGGQSLEARTENSNSSYATIHVTSSLERMPSEQTDTSDFTNVQDWSDTDPSHLTNGFKPSRASKNVERSWTQDSINRVVQAGVQFNQNFKSDVSEFWLRNQSCPEHFNCAVRIENISSDATMKEIFDMFREGKVFSFSISPPKPGRFVTCAARLVFTTRAAAQAFISKTQIFPGISLRGHRWRVWWNRDRCCPVQLEEQHQSRVLQMSGPVSIMSAEGMENLFRKSGIKFQLVDLREWSVDEEQMIAELSFSSILGQSALQ